MTKAEIAIEKYLDKLNLRRLEDDRNILDMDGYNPSPPRTFSNQTKAKKRVD